MVTAVGWAFKVRQADVDWKKVTADRNPVGVVDGWEVRLALDSLCDVSGCVSVAGNGEAKVFGTRSSLALFEMGQEAYLGKKDRHRFHVEAGDAFHDILRYSLRKDAPTVANRENRMQVLKVAWKIAEVYPFLRCYECKDAEIVLYDNSAKNEYGQEYYLSGDFATFGRDAPSFYRKP